MRRTVRRSWLARLVTIDEFPPRSAVEPTFESRAVRKQTCRAATDHNRRVDAGCVEGRECRAALSPRGQRRVELVHPFEHVVGASPPRSAGTLRVGRITLSRSSGVAPQVTPSPIRRRARPTHTSLAEGLIEHFINLGELHATDVCARQHVPGVSAGTVGPTPLGHAGVRREPGLIASARRPGRQAGWAGAWPGTDRHHRPRSPSHGRAGEI